MDLDHSMIQPPQMLTVTDHNRSFSAMTYIYPVVSRRAGGVSVGINLNPNNACNWHYYQVPGRCVARRPISTWRCLKPS